MVRSQFNLGEHPVLGEKKGTDPEADKLMIQETEAVSCWVVNNWGKQNKVRFERQRISCRL